MSKGQGLPHGTAEAVLDESRGVPCPAGDERGRAHVASCVRCRDNVKVWKSFAGMIPRLREAEPPEEVVARAKAFVFRRSGVTRRTGLNAALQYGSVYVPLAAGLRGATPDQTVSPDQMVYRAEEFAVELRVSRERTHMVIVGQVTNVRRPDQRLAHVRVELSTGDRVVLRTASNGLGEFHLEHRELDQMWIEVIPQEGRLIRIPLRPKQMAS